MTLDRILEGDDDDGPAFLSVEDLTAIIGSFDNLDVTSCIITKAAS